MKNLLRMADAVEGGGVAAPAVPTVTGSLLTPAAGAAPADWRTGLPDDLKADPSLAAFKDVGSLAKSYVHAQKLVGVDKIPTPQKTWTEAQWGEHYERLGRPKDAKEYGFPKDFKPPAGVAFDAATLTKAKSAFHKAGLTSDQASAVLALYGETTGQGLALQEEARNETRRTTLEALEGEWKSSTQLKLQLAQSAMMKYGGTELRDYLESTGLGNNPALIKMFAAIGEKVSEDGVGGAGLVLPTHAAAAQELQRLNSDAQFQEALNSQSHPNHKSAVDKRLQLFKLSGSV